MKACRSATYAIEAESDLEQNSESSLKISLANFIEKGGTLIPFEEDSEPYAFSIGDAVFPSCSGANNRSQTLWNLLLPYNDRIILMNPHATRYGFDPYNGKANWHRTGHSYSDDEFIFWAGIQKSCKFGFDLFGSWLLKSEATEEELNILWKYYSEQYFVSTIPAETKRIYITFSKNTHVHLFRLCQTNSFLKNVVVLSFPFDDLIYTPLPEWNTYRRSKQAYINLAAMISKHLDFSNLR